jgi:hypothetical protein
VPAIGAAAPPAAGISRDARAVRGCRRLPRNGAAEVAAFLKYHGSYTMTFAGYNAGRGRFEQWAQHGDPRDPKEGAVDWVERIPFRRDAQLRPAWSRR